MSRHATESQLLEDSGAVQVDDPNSRLPQFENNRHLHVNVRNLDALQQIEFMVCFVLTRVRT